MAGKDMIHSRAGCAAILISSCRVKKSQWSEDPNEIWSFMFLETNALSDTHRESTLNPESRDMTPRVEQSVHPVSTLGALLAPCALINQIETSVGRKHSRSIE